MSHAIYKDVHLTLDKNKPFVEVWPSVRKAMQKAGIPEFRIARLYKACVLVKDDPEEFQSCICTWINVRWE